MKVFILTTLLGAADAICNCNFCDSGPTVKCHDQDPNSYCQIGAPRYPGQSPADSFNDNSGCVCNWGLKFNAKAGKGHYCSGSAPPAPPAPTHCRHYTVVSGDTCQSIAQKFHTDLAHVSLGNGRSCPWMIYPGQIITVCPSDAPTGCKYHTVVSGDTCTKIASEFSTDIAHVFTADGSACPWMIYPNQDVMICPSKSTKLSSPFDATTYSCRAISKLVTDNWCMQNCDHDPSFCPAEDCKCSALPTPPAPKCSHYEVVPGDTCQSIAQKFHTDLAHVSLGNGRSCPWMIYPGQIITVCPSDAPTGCKYHTVVSGDTCTKIASEFSTDIAHVFTADGSACPWMIYPNQDVMICPSKSAKLAATEAPAIHRAPTPVLRSGAAKSTILAAAERMSGESHMYQTQYSGPDCTGVVVKKIDVNPENQCTKFVEGGSGQYYCNYDTLTEADWTKCSDCKSCRNDRTTTRPNGYCFNVPSGNGYKSVSNSCVVTPSATIA